MKQIAMKYFATCINEKGCWNESEKSGTTPFYLHYKLLLLWRENVRHNSIETGNLPIPVDNCVDGQSLENYTNYFSLSIAIMI
jgi:hypothetical protein